MCFHNIRIQLVAIILFNACVTRCSLRCVRDCDAAFPAGAHVPAAARRRVHGSLPGGARQRQVTVRVFPVRWKHVRLRVTLSRFRLSGGNFGSADGHCHEYVKTCKEDTMFRFSMLC